ncbi:glycyl-tRNA synthetase beta chain [Thalassococcus halodurans]|uniref:Glycine--tRNA ligase beta subunit n=1 Tax=Thalassococcus halodurans TaxID=373675 RepID=A0A1H5VZW8_9RHOB|nr:glycine--tRNA ligase subunit beta [Thalassococcus halodurans]SEF92578.1 glycyl-tRNA synthetase beta chain [Thalassococcus halodurans]
MSDLLIELFSEEIPARMQARASEDLKKMVTDGLVEAGLTYAHAGAFATPRRLTLTIEGLLDKSPDVREERKGPRADAPEKAIEGFLRGAGVSREDLIEREEKKGTILYAIIEKQGRPAAEIVAEVLEKTIRTFPWPKSMRWGTGSLRWVRPLHRILCILTDDAGEATVVPLDVDGIQASNVTEGHRFMAPDAFTVSSFDDYTTKLKRAYVLINPEERAEMIWNDATNAAFANGLEVVEDRGLLAENAGLVEWPVTLMGAIADEYLSLPPEVLQTSMKEHQKFFSVKNPSNGRIERFITVANRETSDNGATILAGNLKVLSARLADAKFFWENDLRVAKSEGLEAWTAKLSNVTFHNKLGSQKDRIDRIAELARKIAPSVGADADLSAKAALVVKADLSSEMVFEFPELQGLMGRYYSEAAGLPAEIANACEEHYSPLGPSDDVPTAPVSVTVALADKLDVLTGFWAIDEKPTGSKDPFALRRAALGVIRLLLTNDIRMSLSEVFGDAEWSTDLLSFFHDRLKVFLRDDGIRHDVIDACLAMPGNDDITLLVKRARALSDVLKTEDGENMVQGFKRANNILTQAEEKDGVEYSFGADPKFADTPEEKALFAAFDAAEEQIKPAMEREDFAAAMQAMATMRGAVDGFFEAVQVNADSDILRRNRLNMLSSIRSICLQVADLTQLEG